MAQQLVGKDGVGNETIQNKSTFILLFSASFGLDLRNALRNYGFGRKEAFQIIFIFELQL
jgi:hypothetical protein